MITFSRDGKGQNCSSEMPRTDMRQPASNHSNLGSHLHILHRIRTIKRQSLTFCAQVLQGHKQDTDNYRSVERIWWPKITFINQQLLYIATMKKAGVAIATWKKAVSVAIGTLIKASVGTEGINWLQKHLLLYKYSSFFHKVLYNRATLQNRLLVMSVIRVHALTNSFTVAS